MMTGSFGLLRSITWSSVALLLVCNLGAAKVNAAPAAKAPNILFIMADDLGWGDVEFHGAKTPTPNLDRLRASGIELTQHYVAPLCSPTRVSLLTGRFWSRFGITAPTSDRVIADNVTTLPRALTARGYTTSLIGKWHLGSLPEWGPQRIGFQQSYGSLGGGVTPYSHQYKRGPFVDTWRRNGESVQEEGHVTDLLTAEAVRQIATADSEPFFIYVPFTAIHLPIAEPELWVAKAEPYAADELGRQYAACVMHLDDSVGKLVDALRSKGVLESTVIVFTSDNGASNVENNNTLYPGGPFPAGELPGSNAPLRGTKGQLYEGGIRVPTIVSWPAKLAPGRRDAPTTISDWMPTLCEWAGFHSDDDLKWDGVSLCSLLAGGQQPIRRMPLYFLGPGGESRAVRVGPWKLICSAKLGEERHELFNLQTDPNEKADLASAHPSRVKELLEELKRASERDGDAALSMDETTAADAR